MPKPSSKSNDPILIDIDGDDGVLSLVVASEYSSFVHPDWDEDNRLWDHFQRETDASNVLVWSCGDGGDRYRLKISKGFSEETGYRESVGTLRPKDGKIHIASYTALTMAAQFDDCFVPAKDEEDICFEVPHSPVKLRIVQLYDSKTVDYNNFPPFHFLIEYESGEAPPSAWEGMQWDNLSRPTASTPAASEPAEAKKGFIARLSGKRKK